MGKQQFIRYYHRNGTYTRCKLPENYDYARYGWVLEATNG